MAKKKGKLTKKKFLSYSPADIGKMKQSERRQLLRGARQLLDAQVKMLDKYERSVFSYAYDKLKDYYKENGTPEIRSMTNQKLYSEIFRLQEFFGSKTATIPGARKVALEQDFRIFGVNEKTGKPTRRMTVDERKDYWDAYDEFKAFIKEDEWRNFGSNAIQQVLSEYKILGAYTPSSDEEGAFSAEMFRKMKEELVRRSQEENWENSGYDYARKIFSGKRGS